MLTESLSAAGRELRAGSLLVQSAAGAGEPVLVRPASPGVSFSHLLEETSRDIVREQLLKNGAVLVKGFSGLDNLENFQRVFSALCGEMLRYQFQTSPRTEVDKSVYTSTDHPASQVIHMHTESSYSNAWPGNIGFFCLVPPAAGGQTPIAREKDITAMLGEKIMDRFRDKKIMYTRNFTRGIGLSWQKAYQVATVAEVEQILTREGMQFSWIDEGHLRVSWVMPAFRIHPLTGEEVWFNHMYFGHKTLYDKKVRSVIPEDLLPFLTCYGDGTAIEEEVVGQFAEAYARSVYAATWEKGDLLLLDNMLFSHGRYAYSGERKILVGMANEVRTC